jgi:hypothetical protein
MKRSMLFRAAATAVFCAAASTVIAQVSQETTTTTVTSVTGTITQLNYGDDGQVQGFLIGTDVLLTFPSKICGGAGTLGAVGNAVTYSGTAFTATSGFESVKVSSFTNTTTNATYTAPTSSSTAFGPTTGTVKQLNYSGNGSINGFLFAASSSTAFVAIGHTSSTTLSTLLTVGASVSVTGTTSPNMSACSSTGVIEAVDATSLTIGATTIVIQGGGHGHGGGHGAH